MRLLKRIDLPKDLKEGWAITHDYLQDQKNISSLHKAINDKEKDLDKFFTPSKNHFDYQRICYFSIIRDLYLGL